MASTNADCGHECGDERKRVTDRIRRLIAQVCMVEVADVGSNGRLLAFGIDSVRVIELMMCIEDDFQVRLEQADLCKIATVGELAEYVENLIALKKPE